MKIRRTPEIDRFFQRCTDNMRNEDKNRFLGLEVTPENERNIQYQMREAGFQEFEGPVKNWPSLFLSSEEIRKNPYTSTIQLDKIEHKDFRYTMEQLPSNQLFNVSGVVFDQKRELNDWMKLRALDQPYPSAVLWQKDDVWMLDAPSESITIDPYAKKAYGKVLTFGLGIGYFAFMALLNSKVQSVTVIEKSPSVISMFKKYILPQFPHRDRIIIIEGDAFDSFNESTIAGYDYVFVDIWKSSEDGFLIMEKLLQQYLPPFEKVDFWIETSCIEFVPALIMLYFQSLTQPKKYIPSHPVDRRIIQKIKAYFDQEDYVISDVDSLKSRMYDLRTIRELISKNA